MKLISSFFKTALSFNLFFLILNFAAIQTVQAQTAEEKVEEVKPLKVYDVEIILFKNIHVPKGSEKIQPTQAPLLDQQFISFNSLESIDAATELNFIIPEENENRLSELAEKIEKSSRYKLLKHLTWRQPGLAFDDALSVHIRTGEQFGNDYSSIDLPVIPYEEIVEESVETEDAEATDIKKIILPLTEEVSEEEKEIEQVWYELEGKITITLARYLHAYVDLVLRIPNENVIQFNTPLETAEKIDNEEEISLNSSTLNNFSFKEHRRMRSRKIHYLDHPEMGMLILITPYEASEEIEFIEEDLNL